MFLNRNIEAPTQIALGCRDGYVLLMVDLETSCNRYVDVGHPITHLHKISNLDTEQNCLDYLSCCGHFSSVKVYYDGQVGQTTLLHHN